MEPLGTSGFGRQLMEKQGWKQGDPLGIATSSETRAKSTSSPVSIPEGEGKDRLEGEIAGNVNMREQIVLDSMCNRLRLKGQDLPEQGHWANGQFETNNHTTGKRNGATTKVDFCQSDDLKEKSLDMTKIVLDALRDVAGDWISVQETDKPVKVYWNDPCHDNLVDFINIKSRNEGIIFRWPKSTLKFTKSYPNLSYSFNPLYPEGKDSRIPMEDQTYTVNPVFTVNGNQERDESRKNETTTVPIGPITQQEHEMLLKMEEENNQTNFPKFGPGVFKSSNSNETIESNKETKSEEEKPVEVNPESAEADSNIVKENGEASSKDKKEEKKSKKKKKKKRKKRSRSKDRSRSKSRSVSRSRSKSRSSRPRKRSRSRSRGSRSRSRSYSYSSYSSRSRSSSYSSYSSYSSGSYTGSSRSYSTDSYSSYSSYDSSPRRGGRRRSYSRDYSPPRNRRGRGAAARRRGRNRRRNRNRGVDRRGGKARGGGTRQVTRSWLPSNSARGAKGGRGGVSGRGGGARGGAGGRYNGPIPKPLMENTRGYSAYQQQNNFRAGSQGSDAFSSLRNEDNVDSGEFHRRDRSPNHLSDVRATSRMTTHDTQYGGFDTHPPQNYRRDEGGRESASVANERAQGSNIDQYFQTEPEPVEMFAQETDNSGQPFTVDETEIQSKYGDLVQYAKTFAEKQETSGSTSQSGTLDTQQQMEANVVVNPQYQQSAVVPAVSPNILFSQMSHAKVMPTSILTPMTSLMSDLPGLASYPGSISAAQRQLLVGHQVPHLAQAILAQKIQMQQQQNQLAAAATSPQDLQNAVQAQRSQATTPVATSISSATAASQDQISQAIAQANANALAAAAVSQQQRLQFLQSRATDVSALGGSRPALTSLFHGGSNPLAALQHNPMLQQYNFLGPQFQLAAGLPAAGLNAAQLLQLGGGAINPALTSLFNPSFAAANPFINTSSATGASNPLTLQSILQQQQLLNNLLQPPPHPQ